MWLFEDVIQWYSEKTAILEETFALKVPLDSHCLLRVDLQEAKSKEGHTERSGWGRLVWFSSSLPIHERQKSLSLCLCILLLVWFGLVPFAPETCMFQMFCRTWYSRRVVPSCCSKSFLFSVPFSFKQNKLVWRLRFSLLIWPEMPTGRKITIYRLTSC